MTVRVNADVVLPCRADRALTRLDSLFGAIRLGDGRTSISRMHWESRRRLRRFYPTVDADIAVTAIDDTSSLLTITGIYRPPFGAVGRVADRAVMHRFAESTATEFADRLGRAIGKGGGHDH